MIEDPELRALFQVENEERLNHLEEGLADLENDPNDQEILSEILRDIHTIKGSSRMLGIQSIEAIAHRLEDTLYLIKKGTLIMTQEVLAATNQTIGAIRLLVDEAISGKPAGIDLRGLINKLNQAESIVTQQKTATKAPIQQIQETVSTDIKPKEATPEISAPPKISSPQLEEKAEKSVQDKIEKKEPEKLAQAEAKEEKAKKLAQAKLEEAKEQEAKKLAQAKLEEAKEEEAKKLAQAKLEEAKEEEAKKLAQAKIENGVKMAEPKEQEDTKKPKKRRTEEEEEEESKKPTEGRKERRLRPGTTIRIDMQQIKELLAQAAILTLVKNRVSHLFEQIDELSMLWEKKSQEDRFLFLYQHFGDQNDLKSNKEISVASEGFFNQIGESLTHLRSKAYEDANQLDRISSSIVDRIRNLSLLPFFKLFDLFPHMVQDIARSSGKEVDFVIEGEGITVDKKIIEEMKDPLMHLIRNAVSHGIELPKERLAKGKRARGTIHLTAKRELNSIVIELEDDGRGLNAQAIKKRAIDSSLMTEVELTKLKPIELYNLVFLDGFSTAQQVSDISGRGVGMSVVKAQVEKFGGTVSIDSKEERGCRFVIRLPFSQVTTQILFTKAHGKFYGIPMDLVESCIMISPNEISNVEEYKAISLKGEPISICTLRHLLHLPEGEFSLDAKDNRKAENINIDFLSFDKDSMIANKRLSVEKESPEKKEFSIEELLDPFEPQSDKTTRGSLSKEQSTFLCSQANLPCIVVKSEGKKMALLVDEIVDEQKIIVTPPNAFVHGMQGFYGATILKTGMIGVIINPFEFIESLQESEVKEKTYGIQEKKRVLLVDDSTAMLLLSKRTFEEAGYNVVTAIDGTEGLEKLRRQSFDAIVLDIEMPQLNGFATAEKIRADKHYANIPIIFYSTLDSKETMERGMLVGGNAYVIKSESDSPAKLLNTVRELLS